MLDGIEVLVFNQNQPTKAKLMDYKGITFKRSNQIQRVLSFGICWWSTQIPKYYNFSQFRRKLF